MIINPRRRNIRTPQPLLHLGNVRLMSQHISGRGRMPEVLDQELAWRFTPQGVSPLLPFFRHDDALPAAT